MLNVCAEAWRVYEGYSDFIRGGDLVCQKWDVSTVGYSTRSLTCFNGHNIIQTEGPLEKIYVGPTYCKKTLT